VKVGNKEGERRQSYADVNPSVRVLMGPGPSDVEPRVLKAMAAPVVGHLDPEFISIMDDIQQLLRAVFQTRNRMTIPVSGTGSAGMETCFVNLVERGDDVLVCVNGLFGERMADVADRCGARVIRVDADWGRIIEPEEVKKALSGSKPKVVAIVHAETSTGVLQPLEEIGEMAREAGALFLVDAVTSLGGHPVKVDEWGIDACYSGTQKCLSCPPGLSPVTFSGRAMEVIQSRKSKVQSWYLDMSMVAKYWGPERTYHHTAPVSMNYALREALRIISEEGLEARFARHKRNHLALKAGLEAMGMELTAQEGHRLWTLNAVSVADGVEDAVVRKRLLEEFGIEIGGGLGALKGRIWRVGLMGSSSTKKNVLLFLAALGEILHSMASKISPGEGAAAAADFYESDPK